MLHHKQLKAPIVFLGLVIAGLLLLVPALIGTTIGNKAFAAGNGYGQGHGNSASNGNANSNGNSTGDHGNNNSNSTNGNNGNQTGSNGQGKGPGDNVSGRGHNASERMQDYVNETAETRHQEHLSMNAPITGPFTANLNYTLNASGNATQISNSSMLENASVTLDLSIWKSTKGVVSMDIMNGTVKIGSDQIQIYSGHAYYLVNKPRLLVYGFVVDNSTSSNSGMSGPSVKLLKLFMSGYGTLPANSSDPALQITVLSPQSKLASEWFLDMSGQVQHS